MCGLGQGQSSWRHGYGWRGGCFGSIVELTDKNVRRGETTRRHDGGTLCAHASVPLSSSSMSRALCIPHSTSSTFIFPLLVWTMSRKVARGYLQKCEPVSSRACAKVERQGLNKKTYRANHSSYGIHVLSWQRRPSLGVDDSGENLHNEYRCRPA